jgi:sugar phosphate isomerase/epimerase
MTTSQLSASTACAPDRSLDEAISLLGRTGFAGVELLAFEGARHSQGDLPGKWLHDATADDLDALREKLSAFSFVTTHAPFIETPLFATNPGICAETRRQIEGCIAGTSAIGGTATVLHANAKPFYSLEETWGEMVTTFRELADVGASHGVRVCVETMYPPTVEQFAQLVREVAHPHFGACIDVGHVAWTVPNELRGTADGVRLYNGNLEALCRLLSPKLFHTHLHDVRQHDWRDHRLCGTGCMDYPRLMQVLSDLGYDGPLTLELEEPEVEGALGSGKAYVEGLVGIADSRSQIEVPGASPDQARGRVVDSFTYG